MSNPPKEVSTPKCIGMTKLIDKKVLSIEWICTSVSVCRRIDILTWLEQLKWDFLFGKSRTNSSSQLTNSTLSLPLKTRLSLQNKCICPKSSNFNVFTCHWWNPKLKRLHPNNSAALYRVCSLLKYLGTCLILISIRVTYQLYLECRL